MFSADTHYDIVYIILTYNSSKYLRQTVDSVLDQKFSGNWVIFISDDCSSDNTAEIITEYHQRFPTKIKYRLCVKNLGIAGNWFSAIEKLNTKYVITLGGDDYLIDKQFLSKNFEIMESNPSLSLSVFDGYMFLDGHDEKVDIEYSKSKGFTADIYQWIELESPMINAQSLFFRRSALPEKFEDWMLSSHQEDWLLIFLSLLNGKLRFTPRKSTMYRIHGESYTRTTASAMKLEEGIKLMNNIHRYTNNRFKDWYGNDAWRYERLSYAYFIDQQRLKALKAAIISFARKPNSTLVKTWMKMMFLRYTPSV